MIRSICVLMAVLYLSVGKVHAYQFKQLAKSDTLTAKFWTTEDGLPINSVNQVVQDDDGYLWFTTYDGIVRFDGVEFNTFNHSNTPEIPHNRATEIYKQDGVGIWISMEHEGVLLLTEEGFQHFGVEDGFSKSDVTQVIEGSKGRMFFTTHDGLYVYEEERFVRFFQGKDEQQDRIRFVFEDEDASIWVATNNGLVHVSESGTIEYNVSENLPDNRFFSVFRNSAGKLLTGTTSGLFELTQGKLVSPSKYSELREADVYRIFEHTGITFLSSYKGLYILKNGNLVKLKDPNRKKNEAYYTHLVDSQNLLWLVGDRGTLSVYRNGEIFDLGVLKETQLDYFIYVFEDREKNIWVTTPRQGIIRIKKALVNTIGRKEGLSEDNILGLLKDSKGRYWVGTRGGGLNLIEGEQVRHFLEHRDIASSVVQSIAEDSVGNIWVGHYQKGLNRISPSGTTEHKLGEKFDINNIHALYTAQNGQLWAGTYGGLVKVDTENYNHTVFKKEDGLPSFKIRYITESKDNSLWIGTLDGGVSHFKNGSFINYSKENGLSSNNIRSIHVDETEENTTWVGTENNGLNRILDGEITYINIEDGLPDYNIHWISEDKRGWLWMSSNKGIFNIEKKSLNDYLDGTSSSFQMIVYGENEGMRNSEGNGSIQEAGIRDVNGRFLFATQEGVAIINSDLQNFTHNQSKVIVKKVIAKTEPYLNEQIVFDPDINDFEIHVHAITFVNPQKTRFRYKLEEVASGLKINWIELGTERIVEFSDISPGKYHFTAQATDKNGSWIVEPASVFITITPKYYQKSWFYLLCIGFGVLLFVGGWRFKHQRLIQDQQKLQKIIDEKTDLLRKEKKEVEQQKEIIEAQAKDLRLSNNAKDKFMSIIAHDLRNPFQAMIGYSDYLYSNIDGIDEDELKESIGIIKDSTQNLLKLTENLLKWANLQAGKLKPQFIAFPMSDVLNKNKALFGQTVSQKNISLNLHEEDELTLTADYNMIDTVVRNLLSNAVKFTPEGGKVTVHTYQKGLKNFLEISDTGIGMTEEMLQEVLSLGKNTSRKGTNNETGTGLGLALCKEMTELNNGILEIKSEVDKGSTFTIIFPINTENNN